MNRLLKQVGSICLSTWLLFGTACGSPQTHHVNAPTDPFDLVLSADQLAGSGDYAEATRRYLEALDHGSEHDSAFVAARRQVVKKLLEIGVRYAPAREALQIRTHLLSQRILSATSDGSVIDGMDLSLFVLLGFTTGRESEVRATAAAVKTRLGPDSRVRIGLSGALERYLVAERQYRDAIADSDEAVVDYYLKLFATSRGNELAKAAIAFTIAHECGAHYEALLGVGQRAEAESLADKLIDYSPILSTFVSLIQHAQRLPDTGAEISRLRERAQVRGVIVPTDVPAI